MARQQEGRKLAQHGEWYIIRRGAALYRARYNPETRSEDRFSLGTGDLRDGEQKLVEWLAAQYRPVLEQPADLALAWVLKDYYDHHASKRRSHAQAKIELRYWAEWWGEATVGDLTPERIERFLEHLKGKGWSDGYVSKILSPGRAALRRAHKLGYLASAPFIPDVMTEEDRRNRDPKGRPLQPAEMAALLDAVQNEHVWRVLVILINTMCRPEAALELAGTQANIAGGWINMNPPGRRQTRKRRPIVPITDTLRPWLDRWGKERLVMFRGKPTTSFIKPFRRLREWAKLDERVTAYSIRHTMGRELRRRRVPGDEISLMLGHRIAYESDTTGLYSPHDPDYCVHAKTAIDAYCREVNALLKGSRRLVIGAPGLSVVARGDGG